MLGTLSASPELEPMPEIIGAENESSSPNKASNHLILRVSGCTGALLKRIFLVKAQKQQALDYLLKLRIRLWQGHRRPRWG